MAQLYRTAYIGLGSNLDNPAQQVRKALEHLKNSQAIVNVVCSSLYQTQPLGPSDQPDFINAVVKIETTHYLFGLLEALFEIESKMGRQRTQQQWGPRIIDLDLLLFGAVQVNSDLLKVPHPGISQRRFVLKPLLEIAPGIMIPGIGRAESLLKNAPDLNVSLIK